MLPVRRHRKGYSKRVQWRLAQRLGDSGGPTPCRAANAELNKVPEPPSSMPSVGWAAAIIAKITSHCRPAKSSGLKLRYKCAKNNYGKILFCLCRLLGRRLRIDGTRNYLINKTRLALRHVVGMGITIRERLTIAFYMIVWLIIVNVITSMIDMNHIRSANSTAKCANTTEEFTMNNPPNTADLLRKCYTLIGTLSHLPKYFETEICHTPFLFPYSHTYRAIPNLHDL